MHVVRFGARELELDPALLAGLEITRILPDGIDPAPPAALVKQSLDHPVGPRLRDLARGAGSAAVLVPGIDRIAGVANLARPILRELDEAGISRSRIRFCLATGTHEHDGHRDLMALLGPEIAGSVEGVVHDCRGGDFVDLGVTTRGTRVQFARAVIESELKILTGRVVPHYFAGFGGGRKALLPGVASYQTIAANHRLTLAPEWGVAPGVKPCELEHNPVHLDMIEACRLARPTFAVSTVLDADHRLVGVFAGETERSHAEACSFARRIHQVCTEQPFDAVITSAGGAPYDMNFMQSLKAVFNVQDGIRPGAPLLWVAECGLGAARPFLDWATYEDEALEKAVRRSYNLTGHNSIMLRHLTRGREVGMVTAMPADTATRLGLTPLATLQAALRWLGARLRPGAHIAYVPFGNVTHLVSSK
jgi:nickel-dependent lactate racemase